MTTVGSILLYTLQPGESLIVENEQRPCVVTRVTPAAIPEVQNPDGTVTPAVTSFNVHVWLDGDATHGDGGAALFKQGLFLTNDQTPGTLALRPGT